MRFYNQDRGKMSKSQNRNEFELQEQELSISEAPVPCQQEHQLLSDDVLLAEMQLFEADLFHVLMHQSAGTFCRCSEI